eukprot:3158906-Prymnesium_polylepis.3
MMFRKVQTPDLAVTHDFNDTYFFTPPTTPERQRIWKRTSRRKSVVSEARGIHKNVNFTREEPYFFTPPPSPKIQADD